MSRKDEIEAGLNKGKPSKRKNLRHNAREAQDYFSAPPSPPIFSYRRPGRGQAGESSN